MNVQVADTHVYFMAFCVYRKALSVDGFPTYFYLVCVVDNHVMKISHVLRGEVMDRYCNSLHLTSTYQESGKILAAKDF